VEEPLRGREAPSTGNLAPTAAAEMVWGFDVILEYAGEIISKREQVVRQER